MENQAWKRLKISYAHKLFSSVILSLTDGNKSNRVTPTQRSIVRHAQREILQENVRDNHCYTQLLKMSWNTHMDPENKRWEKKSLRLFLFIHHFVLEFLKHRDHPICNEVLWPESNISCGLVSMLSHTQTSVRCVDHITPPKMYPFLENRRENLPWTQPY